MKRTLLLLLAAGLFLAACSSAATVPGTGTIGKVVKTEKGQYSDISVAELQTMLQHKDFVFVNVHVPYQGNIAGTDLYIPYDQITQQLSSLPADKSAKIVLYCRSGNMSTIAANALADLGYSNLYQLAGGFDAWKAAGLPLEMTKK